MVAGTVTGLVAPPGELVQVAGDKTHVSCNTKPGGLGVQEIVALSGVGETIVSVGTFVICTAVGKAQKPPVTEYRPLVMVTPAPG